MSEQTAPQQKKKGGSGCLKGCLIALVIMVLLAVGVGIYIKMNWKNWAAAGIEAVTNQVLDESPLEDQEKQEVKEQIARVTQGFKDGDITLEQALKIAEGVAQSPLMQSIFVFAIESKYLDQSGLTDEEKADARLQLQRFSKGIVDGDIPDADAVMEHVGETGPDGQPQLKESVTDEELKAAIAAAKAAADEAGVAEQVEPIDVSEEIRKAVDAVLNPADDLDVPPVVE